MSCWRSSFEVVLKRANVHLQRKSAKPHRWVYYSFNIGSIACQTHVAYVFWFQAVGS